MQWGLRILSIFCITLCIGNFNYCLCYIEGNFPVAMDIDCAWRYNQRVIDIDLVDAGPQKNGKYNAR